MQLLSEVCIRTPWLSATESKPIQGGKGLIYCKDLEVSQATQSRKVAELQKTASVQKRQPAEV